MDVALIPVFVVGLLGSVHCAGMCGGIVGALSVAPSVGRVVPVRVVAARAPVANVFAYNAGRIGSYMVAGALAGGLAQGAQAVARLPALQAGAYWLANLMLAALDRPARMFVAGGLWGWLPCGMVYSVLVTAMLSGSALHGALVMLAFGLGTLPMLLGLGLMGARLRGGLARPRVRLACGVLVLGFGLLGLARAAGGLPHGWAQEICVAPGAGA